MNKILESRLFDAFANASEEVYVFVGDITNGVTRWSKNTVEYFGLEDEYVVDSNHKWMEFIHPDDRHIYKDDIEKIFAGESTKHNCQYRARNKYGEYVWVECKGSAIDADGEKLLAGFVRRIDNQSKYDGLTHLLTGFELMRSAFDENGTMMLIGIDKFRNINSQYGIMYGNRVLIRLTDILNEKVSEDMTVYRFQSDEFIVYKKGSNNTDEFVSLFKDICRMCALPESETGLISFSISAGIVNFVPEDSVMDVLTRAEMSLTYAKDNAVTHYEIYSDEIEKKQTRRKLVSEALMKSINNNFKGFYLVFQPILANTGDKIIACESLIRWKPDNEEIGPCYPDEFISILENYGGINEVGYFVMREAIRQAAEWQKHYEKFNVSFNISYLQLEDPAFVPAIVEEIEKYNLDPTRIVVELTESILAVDTVMVKNSFEILKKYGIQIALDDFGTGNSSFWMLHNIDVDIVKLDQSFIRGLDTSGTGIDYAIVESVGLMCNRIGCQTVAEGVETDAIWKMISKFNFMGLQGYLFSRPVEVPVFEELLSKYNMQLTD